MRPGSSDPTAPTSPNPRCCRQTSSEIGRREVRRPASISSYREGTTMPTTNRRGTNMHMKFTRRSVIRQLGLAALASTALGGAAMAQETVTLSYALWDAEQVPAMEQI